MARVLPMGKCFCGCGETTERTAYFVPGHDKRAEAKVVKDEYGGVLELLTAHGYGAEGRDPTAGIREGMDTRGIKLLEAWSRERRHKVHVALEVTNVENRDGPRARVAGLFHVKYEA